MGSSHQPRHELHFPIPKPWPQFFPDHVTSSRVRLRILQTVVDELKLPGAGLVVARRETDSAIAAARLRVAESPTRRSSSPFTLSRALWMWNSRSQGSTYASPTVSMPAIFSAVTTSSSTAKKSLTKRASASQLDSSAATSPPSPSSTSFPRRVKSKASLRSLRNHDDENDDQEKAGADKTLPTPARTSILRRLSPALAARVKLLDGSAKTTQSIARSRSVVGKISQEHLKELDGAHQDLSIKIHKRGRAWSIVRPSQGKREQSAPSQLDTRGRTEEQEQEQEQEQNLTSIQSSEEVNRDGKSDSAPTVAAEPASDGEFCDNIRTTWADNDNDTAAAMSVVEPFPALQRQSADPNGVESPGETDLEKYLKSSTDNDERPPPPPPKDSPPPPSSASSTVQPYFSPHSLHRTESIFSFSRASFSSQLSQLTSINLPQPSTLEASISSIPNAPAAVKALNGAAQQIQTWINKASDVLSGLDAEDDVEWAAAGGREGLDDVDRAVSKFEGLVNVYVKAIEDVQLRDDVANVNGDNLKAIVVQMEIILKNWARIRAQLKGVKEQVELAMEWEELWSVVLGDVGMEIESLGRLIFEMEEKRHLTMIEEPEAEGNSGLDINELETIVEESPAHTSTPSNKRFSLAPVFATSSPLGTPVAQTPAQDDSNLLGLFARMQPLRASLDFLPMRLSMFQSRAERLFPSACEELDERRDRLERSYKKLESDAEALRKELGEDRWILVFRNAGRQAQKMCESVERSIGKLQEALDTGAQFNNQAALAKRIESFEAKKVHYMPAIDRVVSIIQKGVSDRLTVNGEILGLLSDMKSRVDALNASIKVMEGSVDDLNFSKSQQLRDSISSIITMDSPATGSVVDTPGSSPASSVIISNGNGFKGSSTPNLGGSSRRGSSVGSTTRSAASKVKRYSGLSQGPSTLGATRKSSIPRASLSGSVTSPPRQASASLTPTPASRTSSYTSQTPSDNRPRWNGSTNTSDLKLGHNFKPLSVTTPSPFRKSSASGRTSIPAPSPLSRETSRSPIPGKRSSSRALSRLASPTPNRIASSPTPTGSVLDPPPYSKLRKQLSASGVPAGPRSRQSYAGISVTRTPASEDDPATRTPRPGTALGHPSGSRRLSGIPQPKARSGRESSAGSRNKLDERPKWR